MEHVILTNANPIMYKIKKTRHSSDELRAVFSDLDNKILETGLSSLTRIRRSPNQLASMICEISGVDLPSFTYTALAEMYQYIQDFIRNTIINTLPQCNEAQIVSVTIRNMDEDYDYLVLMIVVQEPKDEDIPQ